MNIPIWTCSDFESALSDYRDGALRLERAAAAREHLTSCDNCAALLASVAQTVALVKTLPQVEPPPRLLANIMSQTLPVHGSHARRLLKATSQETSAPVAGLSSWRKFWSGVATPRFALGVAMSVFAVALLLNVAQVNLRQVFSGQGIGEFSLASVGSSIQRQVSRSWARGVSYYQDLRVVYEIEAAVHQMRQNAAPAAAPPAGHDHSQAVPGNRADSFLAVLAPAARAALRRKS